MDVIQYFAYGREDECEDECDMCFSTLAYYEQVFTRRCPSEFFPCSGNFSSGRRASLAHRPVPSVVRVSAQINSRKVVIYVCSLECPDLKALIGRMIYLNR